MRQSISFWSSGCHRWNVLDEVRVMRLSENPGMHPGSKVEKSSCVLIKMKDQE